MSGNEKDDNQPGFHDSDNEPQLVITTHEERKSPPEHHTNEIQRITNSTKLLEFFKNNNNTTKKQSMSQKPLELQKNNTAHTIKALSKEIAQETCFKKTDQSNKLNPINLNEALNPNLNSENNSKEITNIFKKRHKTSEEECDKAMAVVDTQQHPKSNTKTQNEKQIKTKAVHQTTKKRKKRIDSNSEEEKIFENRQNDKCVSFNRPTRNYQSSNTCLSKTLKKTGDIELSQHEKQIETNTYPTKKKKIMIESNSEDEIYFDEQFSNDRKYTNKSSDRHEFGEKFNDMFGLNADTLATNTNLTCCYGETKIKSSIPQQNLTKQQIIESNETKEEFLLVYFKNVSEKEHIGYFLYFHKQKMNKNETTKNIDNLISSVNDKIEYVKTSIHSGKIKNKDKWHEKNKQIINEIMDVFNKFEVPENKEEVMSRIKNAFEHVSKRKEFEHVSKRKENEETTLQKNKITANRAVRDFFKYFTTDEGKLKNQWQTQFEDNIPKKTIESIQKSAKINITKQFKKKETLITTTTECFNSFDKTTKRDILLKIETFTNISKSNEKTEHIFIDSSFFIKSTVLLTFVVGMSPENIIFANQERKNYVILMIFKTTSKEGNDIRVRESTELYTRMLEMTKLKFKHVKSASCDFSKMFNNALLHHSIKIIGCYFHYKQAVFRKLIKTKYRRVSNEFLSIVFLHPINTNAIYDMIDQRLIKHKPDYDFANYILKTFNKSQFKFKEAFENPKFEDFFVFTNNAVERQFGSFQKKYPNTKKHNISENLLEFMQNKITCKNKEFVGGNDKTKSKSQLIIETNNIEKLLEQYNNATQRETFQSINRKIGKFNITNYNPDIRIEYFNENTSNIEEEEDKPKKENIRNKKPIEDLNGNFSSLGKRIQINRNEELHPPYLKHFTTNLKKQKNSKEDMSQFKQENKDNIPIFLNKKTVNPSEKRDLNKKDELDQEEIFFTEKSEDYYEDDDMTIEGSQPKTKSQAALSRKLIQERKALTSKNEKIKKNLDIDKNKEIFHLKMRIEKMEQQLKNKNEEENILKALMNEEIRIEREARLKAEEKANTDREQITTLEEEFKKKIKELEEELKKTQTLSNEVPYMKEPDLNTDCQNLCQINYKKHVIKSDLLKTNQNNLMIIETKNTFEKSEENGENDGKREFSQNEVFDLESKELFTDDREACQTITNNQHNIMPQPEANQENCGLSVIRNDDVNCNQNPNMGNSFGMIFGEEPKKKKKQKKEEEAEKRRTQSRDESVTITNDKSKSKKRGRKPKRNRAPEIENLKKANAKRR